MTVRFRALLLLPALLLTTAAWAIPEGPAPATPEWIQREAANYARVTGAPVEQASNPVFMQRLIEQGLANEQSWLARALADPSWLNPLSGNTPLLPLCTSWALPCAGDPFRYPGFAGPDGDAFYNEEAEVIPVVFYDRGCARISGRVWAPRNNQNGLPAVVIENGSVQAPEPIYWWAAQALVRAGYVVMTFDPRGQGRSDFMTQSGGQGGNFNSAVFWEGLVDAIDFFRSSSVRPYPYNDPNFAQTCAGTYPTETTAFNPLITRIDMTRLGIAGHSLGARGVSVVQAYGAEGAEAWPGKLDAGNPVDVVVAWDSLSSGDDAVPRVPAMGQTSEYGLAPVPNLQAPDPESHKGAFAAWQDAGLPVVQFTIQGSSHYEWSLIPAFPTTSWCKVVENGRCKPGKEGGWGRPMAEHYTVAWFDRWLKKPGETGYCDADARLLADADWHERYSFYFRSARNFPDRGGTTHHCDDLRAGPDSAPEGLSCTLKPVSVTQDCGNGGSGGSTGTGRGNSSGGGNISGYELWILAGLALLTLARRRFTP